MVYVSGGVCYMKCIEWVNKWGHTFPNWIHMFYILKRYLRSPFLTKLIQIPGSWCSFIEERNKCNVIMWCNISLESCFYSCNIFKYEIHCQFTGHRWPKWIYRNFLRTLKRKNLAYIKTNFGFLVSTIDYLLKRFYTRRIT